MSLDDFLKGKKSLNGFKEEKDPDIIGLDFDIISQEHKEGMQLADSCMIDEMSEHFAWMRGNQNCWTGFANRGKTQFNLYMDSVKALLSDWKFCIWSPEMRRANFVDGKVKIHYNRLAYEIMATMSGKTPFKHISEKFNIPFMNLDEKEHWYKWIKEHFIFLEPKEKKIDDIHDVFLRVYENYGVDAFLIDPFKNIDVDNGTRDDRHLHRAFAKFQDLAVRTNTVMNWIAHPKSGVSQVIQKGNESTAAICNQYMLAGGAAWDNSMDGIYTIHRPDILENKTSPNVEFINLKERDHLLVATPGTVEDITFDIKTRRYYFGGNCPLPFVEQPEKERFPETTVNFDEPQEQAPY